MKFIGLKYRSCGMAMEPYYIVLPSEDGYELFNDFKDIPWAEIDGDSFSSGNPMNMMSAMQGGMMCMMQEGMPASLSSESVLRPKLKGAKTVSEDIIRPFFDELFAAGVAEMDGFSKSVAANPHVTDTGSSFSLKILCDDGKVISASGYNCVPENYAEIRLIILRFFSKCIRDE